MNERVLVDGNSCAHSAKGNVMPEQEQQRPGFVRKVATHLWNRAKAFFPEVWETTTDKVIPHGASELSAAINHGASGFVMYGPTQQPLDVKSETTVHGKKEPAKSYDDHLKEYAGRGGPEQDQDRGIDR